MCDNKMPIDLFTKEELGMEYNELSGLTNKLRNLINEMLVDESIPNIIRTKYVLKATMIIEVYNQQIEFRKAQKGNIK